MNNNTQNLLALLGAPPKAKVPDPKQTKLNAAMLVRSLGKKTKRGK